MNKTVRLSRLERNFVAKGSPYRPSDRIITGFRFEGMPPNQEAFTNNFGSHISGGEHQAIWKILRVVNGIQRQWAGAFRTADEAQSALEIELERESAGAVM